MIIKLLIMIIKIIDNDNENNRIETINYKIPKYSIKMHLPQNPGSFVFRKNGKYRLDQTLQRFCIRNQCIGVLELKVNLHHINVNHINFEAKNDGIYIDTFKDQKKI